MKIKSLLRGARPAARAAPPRKVPSDQGAARRWRTCRQFAGLLAGCMVAIAASGPAVADTNVLHAAGPLPDPIIGIVEVPRLYYCEACDVPPTAGAKLVLRAMPDPNSRIVAEVDADGLLAAEYGYETAGALVFERRAAWFRVAHDGGTGWVGPDDVRRFLPLESLLRTWGHATAAWDRRLASRAGGALDRTIEGGEDEAQVEILDRRVFDGVLWLEVRLVRGSPCDEGLPLARLPTLARGWLPALARSGHPNVWFFSRGC